mgnify:CR=1 FL=1|jgi:uncharacterized protein
MTDLSLAMEIGLAVGIVSAGGVIRGFTGFGMGFVLAPLLTLLWGPVEAVATTLTLGVITSVQLVIPALRLVQWRNVAPMMIGTLFISPLGTHLLLTAEPGVIKQFIAGAVLVLAIIMLRGWVYRGPRGVVPSMMVGSLGGFLNGIAAVGGGPVVLYLMSLPDKTEVHRANIVISIAFLPVVACFFLMQGGALTQKILVNDAILVVPTMLGVWAGARLFKFLPEKAFRLTVLWTLIFISGAMLVV